MRLGWLALFSMTLACGARTAPAAERADGGTSDASVVEEVCDGRDQDGDGRIDEAAPGASFGPRVRIRTDEGSTGTCSRCRWARTARLLPTRGGMRALAVISDESGDVPNLFARSLDPEGRPDGPWEPLFETPIHDWFPGLRRDREGGHAVGTVVTVERASWLAVGRLDAAGEPVLGLEPFTSMLDGRHPPDVVALADGSLLAAYTCSGVPDLCLARLGASEPTFLPSLGSSTALLDREGVAGLSSPSMDARGDRLAMAALQVFVDETARLLFFVLDTDGRIVGEHVLPLPPEAFRYRPFDTVHLHATDEGWFVMFARRDGGEDGEPSGRWVARFDVSGELVDGPTNLEPDHFYYGSATHLQPHPAGGWLMSGLRARDLTVDPPEEEGYVAYLDPAGRMRWDLPVRDLDAAVVLDDGRIFAVLNPGLTPGEPNPLDVVEVRCVPH